MALAVTHILVAILVLDLLRHYVLGLKKFPRYLVVIGGISGLAPDIDIPLSWLVNFLTGKEISWHGLFTHSLIFVILFILIAVVLQYQRKTTARLFYVIAAGWLIHIILDWLFGEYKALFWPIMVTDPALFPPWKLWNFSAEIDAIILVLWLVHEEVHQKIKDYF